jgi:signal transduction histidine kinase
MAELLGPVLNTAGRLASEKGLELATTVETPDAELTTDVAKVRRIAANLLSNAVKFTDQGQVRLRTEVQGEDLVLSVSDSGPGIPLAAQERIFESFWVSDRPLVRSVGGTGIGLSLARQFAAALGGTLSVSSTVGAGTTFTLRVPAHVTPEG